MRSIYEVRPSFGCDPEFFFAAPDGKIVGAETILPEGGLKYNDKATGTRSCNTTRYIPGGGVVVIDGVQAEMHPHPNTCRANIIFEVSECFRTIAKELTVKGMSANFERTVVEVDRDVLEKLSDTAKKLGCAPSKNAYGLGSAELAAVNAVEYRKRSAGGHIHIGQLYGTPEQLAEIHDYVVGNTCVLLDRDPDTAERRRLYGRAGEFRTPLETKGSGAPFEYRTLSNFWLRDPRLMSLVLGLSRLACSLQSAGVSGEVKAAVPRENIIEAINTNNLDLAWENFNKIRPLLEQAVPYYNNGLPLWKDAFPAFEFFAKQGLDHWFPADGVIARWCNFTEGHGHGWESYMTGIVIPAFQKHRDAAPTAVAAPAEPPRPAPATIPAEPDVKRPAPLRDAHGRFAPAVKPEVPAEVAGA